jgi:uridine kinase
VRAQAINTIADCIESYSVPHPLRVAVDGRTASGKTTLADEVAVLLRPRGRQVIRTSVDGFHRPRADRYRRGRHSPEGYLDDARDWHAIRRFLLDPLGPNGDRCYRTASFDLDRDEPVEQPAVRAEPRRYRGG